MKKITFIRLFIALIVSSVMFVSCEALLKASQPKPQKPKPVTQNPSNTNAGTPEVVGVLGNGGTVSMTANLQELKAVNDKILGINAAFSFNQNISAHPEVVRLTNEMAPRILRFPGGTIANYYHPGGKGYGFKESEMRTKVILDQYTAEQYETQDFVVPYIKLAKSSGAKCLYVANLLTGTVEEAITTIDKIQSGGVEVIGVELGNELYFGEYRNDFPDANSYVTKAKSYAAALRKKYPTMKIAVIAAKVAGEAGGTAPTQGYATEWNDALAKETFYDAFVVHSYVKDEGCTAFVGEGFDKVFLCEYELLSAVNLNYADKLYSTFKKWYNGKKMWYTEWNIKSPQTMAGNTFVHAAYVTEFFMNMMDYNLANNNALEISTYHNFCTSNYGYTTIAPNRKNLPNLNGNKEVSATGSYYAFKFLGDILKGGTQSAGLVSMSTTGLDNKQFNARLFYNVNTKKAYLYFLNRSGGNITIDKLDGIAYKTAKIKYIKANKLYSAFGETGFVNKYPDKQNYVEMFEKDFTTKVIEGPFSYGFIEFSL